MLYKIVHPTAGFTGYCLIDFHNGLGSTSSLHDAVRLLETGLGFKLIATAEERARVAEFRAQLRKRRAQSLKDFKKLDAFERTPAGVQHLLEKKEERERDAAEARERRQRPHRFGN